MASSQPKLAFDSSVHAAANGGTGIPYRAGCKFVLPRSGGLAADTSLAEDVLGGSNGTARPDADDIRFQTMFPNNGRLK